MSKKQKSEDVKPQDSILTRLDALIRLFVEINKSDPSKGINEAGAARILNSVGLTPTEIAKILGKKSRTDISKYLYRKKKKGKSKKSTMANTKSKEKKV